MGTNISIPHMDMMVPYSFSSLKREIKLNATVEAEFDPTFSVD
jgi:hypothetical protein